MLKSKNKRSSVSWTQAGGFLLLLLACYSLISIMTFDPADQSFFVSSPNNPVVNKGGIVGAYAAFLLRFLFGYSAYLLPMLFLLWSGCFFAEQIPRDRFIKGMGLILLLCSAGTLFGLSWQNEERFTSGGMIGYFLAERLEHYCGLGGGYLIAVFCVLIALTISTDFLFAPWVRRITTLVFERITQLTQRITNLLSGIYRLIQRVTGKIQEPFKETEKILNKLNKEKNLPREGAGIAEHAHIPPKVTQYNPAAEANTQDEPPKPARAKKERPVAVPNETIERSSKPVKTFVPELTNEELTSATTHSAITARLHAKQRTVEFPPIDLLNAPLHKVTGAKDLELNSSLLQNTLRDFGIEVRVTEIEQGPVITRYELLPAPGVKVQSILTLQDNLALALRAKSIRIQAPIPGKAAVGIEIPNAEAHVVGLRELITAVQLKSKRPRLPLLLGKDTSGKPLVSDLSEMPHLLVAGTTGSGKTVCLNAIIAALLYFLTPDDLKFIMIDPKMVELSTYNGLPHMLAPVVTDLKKAAATLNWVVSEMDSRYKLLAVNGVRNIHAYNALKETASETDNDDENSAPGKMPYIIVIIDELADLMMVVQDKVETAITRLAQLSRAVGIHLILATQRPSVDVITGVIKANFPARISFKVASKIDSRTVLDANGADQLLGRGDMLFLEPGEPEPKRGQAPWISDAEINRIVDFFKQKAKPDYVAAIEEAQISISDHSNMNMNEKDEIYDAAVKVVMESGIASVSHLQRRLRLGYSRAARIIDMMEAEGIVSPPQGSKPREILRRVEV